MSATTPDPKPDDRLARAEAVLRDAPVPKGPAPEVIAQTRAALQIAANRPTLIPVPWRRTILTMLKLTAAALAAAAGLSYLAFVPRAEATVTFAEVAQKLHDAHTLSFRMSVQMPGQKGPTTGREYYKDPGLVRTEIDAPQAAVTIIDTNLGKILMLDPPPRSPCSRTGNSTQIYSVALRDRAGNQVEQLRAMAGKEGKPAGKRRIGDVEAQGFQVEADGFPWTVWVDAGAKAAPLDGDDRRASRTRTSRSTMSDFQIDPKLDDSLFRLEPPQGYTLKKIDAPIAIGEQDARLTCCVCSPRAPEERFRPRPSIRTHSGSSSRRRSSRIPPIPSHPRWPVTRRELGLPSVRAEEHLRIQGRRGEAGRRRQGALLVSQERRGEIPGDLRRSPCR